jgi:putative hydrolase of HD superfamily
MEKEIEKILEMIRLAHRLKVEGRHCWYNDGRRESVAEHVWCMAFMAMLVAPHLSYKVDMEKVLKMVIVHDLVEAIVGDTPFFLSATPDGKAAKQAKEKAAMEGIHEILSNATGDEIKSLWLEYEAKETPEAKFCGALDKLEANIQHNNSPIDTWTEKDQMRAFQIAHYCQFDPILSLLHDKTVQESICKMESAGIDTKLLRAKTPE